MREFTFKPALFRDEVTWAIKDGHLMRKGGASALNLAAIDKAVWYDVTLRGTRSTWLHLQAGETVVKVDINDSGFGKHRSEALGLLAAICDTLGEVNPELQMRTDGGEVWRAAMFFIFALSALFAAFMCFAGATGVVKRGDMTAMLGGGSAAIFAGWLAWRYAPWRGGIYASPDALAALIRADL